MTLSFCQSLTEVWTPCTDVISTINTLHHRGYLHLTSSEIYLSAMFAPWCLLFGLLALVRQGRAHGRLVEPPSRFSAWRLGFSTPAYYNDSETNCGGFGRHQVSNQSELSIDRELTNETPGEKRGPVRDLRRPLGRAQAQTGKQGRGFVRHLQDKLVMSLCILRSF